MLTADYIPRGEVVRFGGIDVAEARHNTGMRLMPATVAALDAAGDRMGGKSRAYVVEVLTALYAHKLDAGTTIPIGLVPVDTRAKRAKPPEPEPEQPTVKRRRSRT